MLDHTDATKMISGLDDLAVKKIQLAAAKIG